MKKEVSEWIEKKIFDIKFEFEKMKRFLRKFNKESFL